LCKFGKICLDIYMLYSVQSQEILEELMSNYNSNDSNDSDNISIIIQRQNRIISSFLLSCVMISIGMLIYYFTRKL